MKSKLDVTDYLILGAVVFAAVTAANLLALKIASDQVSQQVSDSPVMRLLSTITGGRRQPAEDLIV